MPPWLIDALAHLGASAPVVLLLAWLYTRERAERVETQKLLLELTRELVQTTAQIVHSTDTNTKATMDAAEKMNQLLQRRLR